MGLFKKRDEQNKPKLGEATNPNHAITTSITELNYTERYEYACSMIKLYLDREEAIEKSAQNGYVSIFKDISVMYTTFTMDFRMLSDPAIAGVVIRQLTLNNDNKSSNIPLVRFYNVFYDVCAALGTDFIKQLSKNIQGSLLLTAGIATEEQLAAAKANLSATLAAIPIILLFILGSKDYNTRYIIHQSRAAALQSTPQTTRKAQ